MALARELIEQGGLWNSFIVVSTAQALLSLFRRRIPQVVMDMRAAVQSDLYDSSGGLATASLYERLPAVDFSREILQGHESRLRVLPVPRCGWSDLGTPQRVADALRHVSSSTKPFSDTVTTAYMSLAAQHARLMNDSVRLTLRA